MPYAIGPAELKAALDVGEAAIASGGGGQEVDWETVHGLLEAAVYGARVDDRSADAR